MKSTYKLYTAYSVTYGEAGNLFDSDSDEATLSLQNNSTLRFKCLPLDLAYKLVASKYVRFTVKENVGAWR